MMEFQFPPTCHITTNCFYRRILYQLGESAGRGASTSLLFRASRALEQQGFLRIPHSRHVTCQYKND